MFTAKDLRVGMKYKHVDVDNSNVWEILHILDNTRIAVKCIKGERLNDITYDQIDIFISWVNEGMTSIINSEPITSHTSSCTCGAHKTYGISCSLTFHSSWCDVVNKDKQDKIDAEEFNPNNIPF